MTYFLSKKKKQEVKARQRKKKLAELEGRAPPRVTNNNNNDNTTATTILSKKRLRDEIDNFPLVPPIPETISNVIPIPKHLSAKEVKKFRKDERRKARKEGRDESLLKFTAATNSSSSNGDGSSLTKHNNNSNKKPRREFPKINEILNQQTEAKAAAEAQAAKQKAEDRLPAEYKDQYLAMDCEMVGIGTDGKISALARVSITNWAGDVVLDTFVQVPGRVTDFRTWVSGVEAKHLKSSAAMEVDTCRKTVAKILKGKILVGHSLQNDLHALMLNHPKADMRDTAKYRPLQRLGGKKWRPRKLKDLVQEHVGMIIQQDGQSHDSIDDAKATMELFKCVREAWERDLTETNKRRKD